MSTPPTPFCAWERLEPRGSTDPRCPVGVVGHRRGFLQVLLGLSIWAQSAVPGRASGTARARGQKSDSNPRSSSGSSYPLLGGKDVAIRTQCTAPGRWRFIIGHHSATAEGSLAEIDAYHRNVRHMEHGFAYHFVIGNGRGMKDGAVAIGNRWACQLRGGHLRNLALNEKAIGICLVGNFENVAPTRKQIAALTQLVTFLTRDVLPTRPTFLVHREVKGERTLCPGRHFPVRAMHALFG